jgi:hypothetical protein
MRSKQEIRGIVEGFVESEGQMTHLAAGDLPRIQSSVLAIVFLDIGPVHSSTIVPLGFMRGNLTLRGRQTRRSD